MVSMVFKNKFIIHGQSFHFDDYIDKLLLGSSKASQIKPHHVEIPLIFIIHPLVNSNCLPSKSDSDFMFCLQVIRDV